MIDRDAWLEELAGKLQVAFGGRLLFVGLQGSYRRDEATEKSDIDAVVILDELSIGDLDTYRSVISTMSESEKACGFVSGRAELANWPRLEIFQFSRETVPIYGSIKEILPKCEERDIADSIKVGASTLYHALCHTYLHGDDEERRALLAASYKGAFFIMQLLHYRRTGKYVLSRRDLLPLLCGEERRILEIGMDLARRDFPDDVPTDAHFSRLIGWCSGVLTADGDPAVLY